MDIKGFKSSDGTIHKYDYGALTNVPQSEETPAAGADGGYYTPVVTQPDDNTLQFDFTPSDPEMPSVEPVQVTLPSQDSGGNVDFQVDETLSLKDGILSVNTTNDMEQDNTLPITSAGVFATVGNIEALLKTI